MMVVNFFMFYHIFNSDYNLYATLQARYIQQFALFNEITIILNIILSYFYIRILNDGYLLILLPSLK